MEYLEITVNRTVQEYMKQLLCFHYLISQTLLDCFVVIGTLRPNLQTMFPKILHVDLFQYIYNIVLTRPNYPGNIIFLRHHHGFISMAYPEIQSLICSKHLGYVMFEFCLVT